MSLAISKYAFQGDVTQQQLSFPANAPIRLHPHSHPNGGWIKGSYSGHVGWLPVSYIEIQPQQPQEPPPITTASPPHSHDSSSRYRERNDIAAPDSRSPDSTSSSSPATQPLRDNTTTERGPPQTPVEEESSFEMTQVMGGNDWAKGKELQQEYGEISEPNATDTTEESWLQQRDGTSKKDRTHPRRLRFGRNQKGWLQGRMPRNNKKIAAFVTPKKPERSLVEQEWVATPQVYVTQEGPPKRKNRKFLGVLRNE